MGRGVPIEFYEKLSSFGPEYRMWRMRLGSAGLILISRLAVEELGQLKKAPLKTTCKGFCWKMICSLNAPWVS